MLQRTLHAAGIASGVTFGLLFLMSALCYLHPIDLPDRPDRQTLEWVRAIEDSPIRPDPVRPTRIDHPPIVPPTPQQTSDSDWSSLTIPATGVPVPTARTVATGPTLVDGPLISILRPEPNYPSRAIARNLEGYVIVEFSVMPDGRTADHRVVDSSHAIFESAAVRAAERFRYKPKVVDGVPATSRGIRNVIRFKLDKG